MAPDTQILGPDGEPARDPEAEGTYQAARALNELTREGISQLHSLLYDDDRDVYEVAGYPENYKFEEGFGRYERQHVAGRIVDMPAQTTWRNEPTVEEVGTDTDPDERSEWEETWDGLYERLRLSYNWERLDRMAGIGRFAVQVILFTDTSSPEDLSKPVDTGQINSPEDVAAVSQFKESEVDIADWITDPSSPRFGRPGSYKIDLSGDVETFDVGTKEVHWSRVIHAAESPLDDEVFGRPRLKRVLNLLIDLQKITAATGESYWQLAARILQAKADSDISLESFKDQKDDLEEDLEKMVHDLKRHFLGHGVELEYLGGETPDPSDPVDMLQTLIAGASGIPKRILFGSERGELASTQDTREWLGRISERQTRFAEPQVIRPFIDRLIRAGALEEVEYEVEWPNLFEHDEEQEAEILSTRADAVQKVVQAIFEGGERGVRIAAELIPELEEVLEADLEDLADFAAAEGELEREDLEKFIPDSGNGERPTRAGRTE